MPAIPLRTLKLGGSLLTWFAWPERLLTWLERQPPACNVLIVGGGPLVEGLRSIDQAHHLSATASHWLAIRAMRLNAEIAASLLPTSKLVTSIDAQARASSNSLLLLDAEPILRAEQGRGDALPESWDVTSDSIAAHLARRLDSKELVLLKSALPRSDSLLAAAESGYVDRHFPCAQGERPARCIALRDPDFAECWLH